MKKKGSIFHFILEALATFAVVLAVVYLCDRRRVFASNETNNHTGKKWYYLYQYAEEKKPIDILIVGNSHTYTSILPEVVKNELGLNCFLLAAPGINMDECCCMLEEALKIISPQLVILETYPINNYVQKAYDGQLLSDHFASFANRRDKWLKLKSSGHLFTLDNIPMAWSSTLRNHDILFDNRELLEYNLKNPSAPSYNPDEEYMGRYIRFTTGLTPESLELYKLHGAPVDGSLIKPGPDAVRATRRMVEMCQNKNIPVMFLTIPMYHEHVSGAEVWHENLRPLIGNRPWLDLQLPAYDIYFGPECFENTYAENQHQTGQGALHTTTLLVLFLQQYIRSQ